MKVQIKDIVISPDSNNDKLYKHGQLIKTNDGFIRIIYDLTK